jgi:hypothetical protein
VESVCTREPMFQEMGGGKHACIKVRDNFRASEVETLFASGDGAPSPPAATGGSRSTLRGSRCFSTAGPRAQAPLRKRARVPELPLRMISPAPQHREFARRFERLI